jgi:hypothetical protein
MADTESTYLALPVNIKEAIVKLSEEEHRTIANMTVKLIIEALEARNTPVTES